MKPAKFEKSNMQVVIKGALTDLQYKEIAAQNDGRTYVTLWKPSLRERISFLFHGKLWLTIYGNTLPPIWIEVKKTF